MSTKKVPDNVIPFPGPRPPPPPERKGQGKKKTSAKNGAAVVLAIILATFAVNREVFESRPQSVSLSSRAPEGVDRAIASVDPSVPVRNPEWEMKLAEELASVKTRGPASAQIGRPATVQERLRWGTLEEQYTINYKPADRSISSVQLQDSSARPTYVLDRGEFLESYGALLDAAYDSAKLKSVQKIDGRIFESYTIFDKNNQPKGEVRFELDRHKRLLSLKVGAVET
ncbi:MAG: hypothetical protein AB7G93_08945 [Bdellovibrionales bacterium]